MGAGARQVSHDETSALIHLLKGIVLLEINRLGAGVLRVDVERTPRPRGWKRGLPREDQHLAPRDLDVVLGRAEIRIHCSPLRLLDELAGLESGVGPGAVMRVAWHAWSEGAA